MAITNNTIKEVKYNGTVIPLGPNASATVTATKTTPYSGNKRIYPKVVVSQAGFVPAGEITGAYVEVTAQEVTSGTESIETLAQLDVATKRYVKIGDTTKNLLLPANIREGVSLFSGAVIGTLKEAAPIDIKTEQGMTEVLVEANVGKVFRYVGEGSENYNTGDLYVVEANS